MKNTAHGDELAFPQAAQGVSREMGEVTKHNTM